MKRRTKRGGVITHASSVKMGLRTIEDLKSYLEDAEELTYEQRQGLKSSVRDMLSQHWEMVTYEPEDYEDDPALLDLVHTWYAEAEPLVRQMTELGLLSEEDANEIVMPSNVPAPAPLPRATIPEPFRTDMITMEPIPTDTRMTEYQHTEGASTGHIPTESYASVRGRRDQTGRTVGNRVREYTGYGRRRKTRRRKTRRTKRSP